MLTICMKTVTKWASVTVINCPELALRARARGGEKVKWMTMASMILMMLMMIIIISQNE